MAVSKFVMSLMTSMDSSIGIIMYDEIMSKLTKMTSLFTSMFFTQSTKEVEFLMKDEVFLARERSFLAKNLARRYVGDPMVFIIGLTGTLTL